MLVQCHPDAVDQLCSSCHRHSKLLGFQEILESSFVLLDDIFMDCFDERISHPNWSQLLFVTLSSFEQPHSDSDDSDDNDNDNVL